ncbi:MAG: photosystem I reaction center subunit II [Cyanophyceae cyanobacterium]
MPKTPTATSVDELTGATPKFGGSTGGLLNRAFVEEKYAITWTSKKEQVFEMPTGGAAIMHEGENLMFFARKEQCIALGKRFRTQMRPKISDYKIYRVFPNGEVDFIHPTGGNFPEKVSKERVSVNANPRRIGENPNPIKVKFTGKEPYDE